MKLTPGEYQWKVVLRDEHNGKVGTYKTNIVVPDFSGPEQSSSLLLIGCYSAAPVRTGKRSGASSSSASRQGDLGGILGGGKRFYIDSSHTYRQGDPIYLVYDLYDVQAEEESTLPRTKLMLIHGPDGLRRIGEHAILAANYLQARLKDAYPVPFGDRYCMHEFVASAAQLKQHGIRALDIAKALLNDGFHAPTVYFPQIVDEAMMIEPTESESLEVLDAFANAMLRYAALAESDPGALKQLPNLQVTHLDEAYAARNLDVRWQPQADQAAAGE
ncbi:hypothetical protein IIA79_07540 [bacterium]|nr:hypothetical protein [bacterium]